MNSTRNVATMKMLKLVAASLFLALTLFNVQIESTSGGFAGTDLLAMKLSVFIPTSEATGSYCKLVHMLCGETVIYYCWSVPTQGVECLPCGDGC